MDFNVWPISFFSRIVAVISLCLGLNDAARVLGVNMGAMNPVTAMGATAFTYLAIFALVRLFAAVGLWIRASWGAVLLVAATGIELTLFLIGSPDIRMSSLGFVSRLVLLVAILVILILSFRFARAHATD